MTTSSSKHESSRRGLRRLHASTYVVLFLTAAVLFFANVPGERRLTLDGTPTRLVASLSIVRSRIEHGWPWTYLFRDDLSHGSSASTSLWSFHEDFLAFSAAGLVGNLAVALVITIAIGGAFEWRRRSRATFWQFSIVDLLAIIALMGGTTAYAVNAVHASNQERDALRAMGINVSDDRTAGFLLMLAQYEEAGPHWLRDLVGDYWPTRFDRMVWFDISTSQLEESAGLLRLRGLEISNIESNDDHLPALAKLDGLEALVMRFKLKPPHGDVEVAKCLAHAAALPRLETLCVITPEFGSRSAHSVSQFPKLRRLLVANNAEFVLTYPKVPAEPCENLTDDGLAALSECKSLEFLDLAGSAITAAGIRSLRSLPTLRVLKLPCAALTDAMINELKKLPALEQLNCNCHGVDPSIIERLAELPKIRRLSIGVDSSVFGEPVRDEDIGAIKRLKAARPEVRIQAGYKLGTPR